MKIQAYLIFDGNCEEAFNRYAQVLGGKLPMLMRFKDAPDMGQIPPDAADRVMHVRLEVGDQVLMGSDNCPPMPYEGTKGVSVSLQVDSKAEARRIYDALSEGGQVTMELQQTFWAAAFAMFTDRFGVPWMVNCEQDR
ncbi:PhnB protein [Pseudomonas delhiensis]|uniref:PhnB protein n=1 Tax=Pseudomonas delhiensis TaxID=366289 RepID=A0A239N5E6_9PSED|nr:VOC family protein [Pseudomonas delhiensis]SDK52715.1 PhnB protein [Pseudomonas delhiensis]SNT49970.1 PhnB protein [Pseudomonas delhiensis]